MEEIELKAKAYDCLVQIEIQQNILREINKKLFEIQNQKEIQKSKQNGNK